MFRVIDIEQRLALSCTDHIESIIDRNENCNREASFRVDRLLLIRERLRAAR